MKNIDSVTTLLLSPDNYPDKKHYAIKFFTDESEKDIWIRHFYAASKIRVVISGINSHYKFTPDWKNGGTNKGCLGWDYQEGKVKMIELETESPLPDCYIVHPCALSDVLYQLGPDANQVVKDFLMIK